MEYDLKGNITQKSDAGNTFSYNTPNKPYAVSEIYDATSDAVPPRNQYSTYTSFERPSGISENNYEALFTYDGSGERKKMEYKNNGSTQYSRYYLGGRYEADLGTSINKQRLYIGGDAYSAPAVYVNQGSGWVLYYICRDYLGSITHLVNSNGTVANEYSYDAWGRLRNPANQTAYTPGSEPELILNRGYTGHEHLPVFGLVNMNARLYDPATGRFLSPDPYVQAPDFSQNFNRYSYALNNPLRYTDPDGEFWNLIIGAAIGGVTNVAFNWNKIDNFWQGLGYFGIGAVAGLAGGYAGTAVSGAMGAASSVGGAVFNGAVSGAAGGFSSGYITGAGNAWMGGSNFGQGLYAGLGSGGFGALGGAVIGGAVSGIRYQKQIYVFRRGNLELGINGEDAVPATDEFLNKAQKVWYKDAPMDKVKIFSVEKTPEDLLTRMNNNGHAAATTATSKSNILTGYSKVYFNKDLAFKSAKSLFLSMGHEFVHVSQFAALKDQSSRLLENIDFISMLDYYAYSYENSIGGTMLNSFSRNEISNWQQQFLQFKAMNYINFSWTFNHSLIYPF
jgi:RHS repeat-associated protein